MKMKWFVFYVGLFLFNYQVVYAAEKVVQSNLDIQALQPNQISELLVKAAEQGDTESISYLGDQGVDVNVMHRGSSPLIAAVSKGRLEAVSQLIIYGANIHKTVQRQIKPIDVSIHGGKRFDVTADDVKLNRAIDVAVIQNHLDVAELLFEEGAIIEPNLLIEVSARGENDLIEFLLIQGGNVNIKNQYGITPLMAAAKLSKTDTANILLEKGAKVTIKDKEGRTPLHYASQSGNSELVSLFLDKGADINAKATPKKQHDCGGSPLHFAICGEHKEVVELLLTRGADIEVRDHNNYTPLGVGFDRIVSSRSYRNNEKGEKIDVESGRALSSLRHDAIVLFTLLLDKGADINASFGPSGDTVLSKAVSSGAEDMVAMLSERMKSTSNNKRELNKALCDASLSRNTRTTNYEEVITLLLQQGADVNAQCELGNTPLHYATDSSVARIALLLDNGADIEMKDIHPSSILTLGGETPFLAACGHGRKDIAEYLLERGADINARDNNGNTALHIAASSGNQDRSAVFETVTFLLDNGENIEARNKRGNTPLVSAAHRDDWESIVTALLLERGADVTAKDMSGRTALHYACRSNLYSIVEVLLENGLDVNVQDNAGNTSLHIASKGRSHMKDLVALLLETGADIQIKNKEGQTPLGLAKEIGIVELLRSKQQAVK